MLAMTDTLLSLNSQGSSFVSALASGARGPGSKPTCGKENLNFRCRNIHFVGAQWLSGRVPDSRPKDRKFYRSSQASLRCGP